MRIRLSSRPPLPPIRAWFSVTSTSQTILELKHDICEGVPALRNEAVDAESVSLSVDEFDLLDDGNVDVLRENDLVCISDVKRPATSLKRKREDDSLAARSFSKEKRLSKKRGRHSAFGSDCEESLKPLQTKSGVKSTASGSKKKKVPVSDTSSSSSSSSSESSSSSTSSDSDSDSDTSSSSTSESSLPAAKSSKLTLPPALQALEARAAAVLAQKSNAPSVPPGEGKRTTQSRNVRRRRKKLAEKEATERAEALSDPNSTNAVPLGVRSASKPAEDVVVAVAEKTTSIPLLLQAQETNEHRIGITLTNKNKKKGFKKAMANAVPERIIFSDAMNVSAETQVSEATSFGKFAKAPRFLTPSEKEKRGLLPNNLFVTSVELESDEQGNWDRRKKKKMRDFYSGEREEREEEEAVDVVELDYGTEDLGETSTPQVSRNVGPVDWAAAEQKWDQFSVIGGDIAMLKRDQLVGWKALGISPVTCSPEMLIHLARVESVDELDRKVNLVVFERPGTEDVGFRGTRLVHEDAEEQIEETVEEEVSYKQTVAYFTMLAEQWKLVV